MLIAHLRPDCTVSLVEVKEYSCIGARERVRRLGLTNVRVFEGTVDAFEQLGEPFDLAVGLHLCG